MTHFNSETRLTDSLERELIERAVHEQMYFSPAKALKSFFSELFSKADSKGSSRTTESVQTAS